MTSNQIKLQPSTVVRVLGAAAFLLVLASIGGQLTKYLVGKDTVYGLISLFYVDYENNIPSFFSASLLLFAALLLLVIAILKKKSQDPYCLAWRILSFVFLYMAVDEATSIHELLERPTRELLGDPTIGIFTFAWVIPGFAISLVFALLFLKFLLHLPLKTRLVVLLAATLFIGGSIGIELVGGHYYKLHGSTNLIYSMIATLEESLEMVGIIVFIYALLTYIEDELGEVRFQFQNSAETHKRRPPTNLAPDPPKDCT